MIRKLILFAICIGGSLSVSAQKMTENDHIRRGHKLYADSLYEKAEIEYRKALEVNPESTDAMFNLGNALFNQVSQQSQEKGKEALELYVTASKLETDKEKLAHINHNLGTLFYAAQQYAQSVEAYKESLRNNPTDHETRYNLTMAMHMLKHQEQKKNQEKQDEQQNQQQDQQQEQNQQNQQQQEQQAQDQQQQQTEEQQKKDDKQTQQLLNLAKQAEKRAKEKVDKAMKNRRPKNLEKNL